MLIICYGDSNTFGYDPRSYLGSRYDADCRWVDLLAEYTGWEVHNNGMNGREIPNKEIAISKSADLVIIMLGTNDLLQGASVRTVANRMESFLAQMQETKERILLIAPPPMQYGEWVSDPNLITASSQLAESYHAVAERMQTYFANAGEWNISLAFDGVHFSEDGHKQFAKALYRFLKEVFQK